jgi:hypothetical protein
MSGSSCLYRLIGCAPTASAAQIKKAYHKQALRVHPDKNQDKPVQAKAQFQRLSEAYATLADPVSRATYDRERAATSSSQQFTSCGRGMGSSGSGGGGGYGGGAWSSTYTPQVPQYQQGAAGQARTRPCYACGYRANLMDALGCGHAPGLVEQLLAPPRPTCLLGWPRHVSRMLPACSHRVEAADTVCTVPHRRPPPPPPLQLREVRRSAGQPLPALRHDHEQRCQLPGGRLQLPRRAHAGLGRARQLVAAPP